MPRKKGKTRKPESDPELQAHLGALGFARVDHYRRWCERNGFSSKLNKHPQIRQRELTLRNQMRADSRLKSNKRSRQDQTRTIADGITGRSTQAVNSPLLRKVKRLIANRRRPHFDPEINYQSFFRLIDHLSKLQTKLFDPAPVYEHLGDEPGNTYLEALLMMSTCSGYWIRQVEDWKPKTRNMHRQFSSLLRHLFVKYEMPKFFDSVWFTGWGKRNAEWRKLFLFVSRGHNLRRANLPVPYTKKMAHCFMQAPPQLTVNQALRWGQVLGLGGNERLARTLLGTRLEGSFEHDAFWVTVIRWFIQHPMLDPAQVGPIIDYLQDQRFGGEIVCDAARGDMRHHIPQPNLTMKGRTPDSLLRQVQQWHQSLGKFHSHRNLEWRPSGILAFEMLEGEQSDAANRRRWVIRELLSSKALMVEGRQMRHGVATYASSCRNGSCSIWTMELEANSEINKAVTIEVRSNTRMICQIRGRANRLATGKERIIISRWAKAAGLKISANI